MCLSPVVRMVNDKVYVQLSNGNEETLRVLNEEAKPEAPAAPAAAPII